MKAITALVPFMLIHSLCVGQSKSTIGVKAGYVSASQIVEGSPSVPNNYSLKHRSGIDAGLFIESHVTSILSFSAEIHYIQKGIKETYMNSFALFGSHAAWRFIQDRNY